MQTIGEILKDKKAQLDQESKCEACKERRKYSGRKWCLHCMLKWQRDPEHKDEHRDEMMNAIYDSCRIEDVIPERYRAASLKDLPQPIVDRIMGLPPDKGILFWGKPGTGKTHGLCAILKYLYYEGFNISRISYEMLCLKIRRCYRNGSTTTELDVINPFIKVNVLAIEDVGTTTSIGEQESDFSLRTFLVLLDQRLEWCRPTFISTNKSVEELGKSFDQRIASRIMQACEVIELVGEDKRRL